MLSSHVLQRLQERQISFSPDEIEKLALNCDCDTAILLIKLGQHRGSDVSDYYSRKGSNGDLVFLIVRSRKAITIMFRRSNQPFTCQALNVNKVVDISNKEKIS